MSKVTKAVAARVAISKTVLSSVEVHGAEVSEALSKLLFPEGEPKKVSTEVFLAALGSALSRASAEISEADIAHARELSDDAGPRAARDEAVAVLRERMINTRGTLLNVYGAGILGSYGLLGETPLETELLLAKATHVEELLRTRPIEEEAIQEGVTVNPTALAKGLKDQVKRVKDALQSVQREEREAQLTQSRRNDAIAAWSSCYQGVADIMTGIYELVGRADLADRVRPTARRRAGLAEEADAGGSNSDSTVKGSGGTGGEGGA